MDEPDDVLMARALQFSGWARRNLWVVVTAVVLLVALVLGGLWWRSEQSRRVTEASAALVNVEQTLQAGNTALAQRDLASLIQEYDGTRPADEARVMLAQIHLQAGNHAEAISTLQGMDQDLDTPLGAQGTMLLAAVQGEAGNTDAAIQSYLRVADGAELDYFRDEALTSAALLQEAGGDFAAAAEIWSRLAGYQEEGSFQRTMYEMRRAEAQGRVAAP